MSEKLKLDLYHIQREVPFNNAKMLKFISGKQTARNFWCPTCQKTSQESCDAALANTTCPNADFCIALWEKQVFARKCVNRKMLEILTNGCRKVDFNTRECKRKKTYTVAWCDKTGCKAQVPKPIQREQTHARAFWCPTCHKTTQETCDAGFDQHNLFQSRTLYGFVG